MSGKSGQPKKSQPSKRKRGEEEEEEKREKRHKKEKTEEEILEELKEIGDELEELFDTDPEFLDDGEAIHTPHSTGFPYMPLQTETPLIEISDDETEDLETEGDLENNIHAFSHDDALMEQLLEDESFNEFLSALPMIRNNDSGVFRISLSLSFDSPSPQGRLSGMYNGHQMRDIRRRTGQGQELTSQDHEFLNQIQELEKDIRRKSKPWALPESCELITEIDEKIKDELCCICFNKFSEEGVSEESPKKPKKTKETQKM